MLERLILEWEYGNNRLKGKNQYIVKNLSKVIALMFDFAQTNEYIRSESIYSIFRILIREGDYLCCKLLIDSGVYEAKSQKPKNHCDFNLATAIYFGNLDICKLLIDSGCKLNNRNARKDTALIIASERGNIDICKLLIDAGCNLNTIGHNGHTALTKAAINSKFKICELLINAGCKIDIGCESGREVLMSVISTKFRINQPKIEK